MTITELNATEIANRVRPYVDSKRIGDITLSFIADHIYLQHGYWHIRISPSHEPESWLCFYEVLADLTVEIQDNENIKITLDSGEPLTGYVLDNSPCGDETEANAVPMRDPKELTPADVANLVRPYIANTTFGGVTVWLDEARIVYRKGFWDLPLRPSVEPDPMCTYVEALAKLDIELRQKEGIQVWLIPGKPLTEQNTDHVKINALQPDKQSVELQLPIPHPLESTLGSFRDDPLWDAMMEAIKANEEVESQTGKKQMSARDKYHNMVKDALIREGWIITHDPYRLTIGRRRGFIDLGAEMPFAAEKEGQRIAVEVKSFLGASELDDLEDALGQYGVYRVILEKRDRERSLYLALPNELREMLLEDADFRAILRAFEVRLIFFNPQEETNLEWIETLTTELL